MAENDMSKMIVRRVDGKLIPVAKVVDGYVCPLEVEVEVESMTKHRAPQHEDLSKAAIGERLERAVMAGKLDSRMLSSFDAHPWDTVSQIPAAVAKEFGIPVVDADSDLAKSDRPDTLPWWMNSKLRIHGEEMRKSAQEVHPCGFTNAQMADAADKLEKAVHAGALDSRVLSDFDAHPLWALGSISADVAQKYGLPLISPEIAAAASPVRMPLGWERSRRPAVSQEAYQPQSRGSVRELDELTRTDLDDARERIEKAVKDGALIYPVLLRFDQQPVRTLFDMPDNIRGKYGLPRVSTHALSRHP
jgi:hypothetical protein